MSDVELTLLVAMSIASLLVLRAVLDARRARLAHEPLRVSAERLARRGSRWP